MKKIFIPIVLAMFLWSCQSVNTSHDPVDTIVESQPHEGSAIENTSETQDLFSINEQNNILFQLPEMTVEQQYFYDEYVRRMLYNNLLTRNWSLEDYSNISTATSELWRQPFLMLAFEDIVGQEAMHAIWDEHGIYIPAEVVEQVLLRHFPFTAKQLREELLYSIFDEVTDTYSYPGGRGGAPREGVVTNIEREGEFVKLSYNVYGPDFGSHYVDTMWLSGVLTLREVDDGFMYWSVEIVFEKELQ